MDVVSAPVSANAVPSCEEWTAMSMAGPRMSARSSAVGDGIGRLYWPMLLMSRELILLMSVSVVVNGGDIIYHEGGSTA